ncbi:uncharacterized protein LOC724585 [Apis mellifera]|uniref:Uncharacterized protein LOC724585 n=1 Tax=Apis mellifera TaxID=7460 RepID=A0A7M7G7E0_APIME|nr:uncharacterized protein LOC724585 [Apis mellifera]|eukprot:XP_001120482.1 uncharacterized protein LOC724585 [Apis mellifera]
MRVFMMQNFHRLTLFIWLVSILTLSISDEIKTDGNTSLTLNINNVDSDSKTEHRISSSSIQFMPESVNSKKIQNQSIATPLVAGEGGPISLIPPTQQTSTISHLKDVTDNLDLQDNLSQKEDDILYVKKKKNTSKIVSRKGADNGNISIKMTLSNDTKPIIEFSTIASNISNNAKIDINMNNSKSNVSDKNINKASNIIVNNTLYLTNVTQKLLSVTTSSVQEHKPKPTATVIESNNDKQAFIPHTKGSRLGMPKKIDYVLPVIVTLIALPVLGAIIFMVYKQGRDCWDKRHYRRMDFLIDGMYND